MRITQLLIVLATIALAGALCAQASLNVSGSVTDNDESWFILDIDFGAGPASATINVSIAATGGTAGLDATLAGIDALAGSGLFSGAADGNNDPGTGTINLSITSSGYSGVAQYILAVATDSGSGTSPFSGSVSAPALATGAISINSSATVPFVVGQMQTILNRAARWNQASTGATTQQREFAVDFGATPQSVAFSFWLQSSGASASAAVYEIDSGGSPQLLDTLSGGAFVESNPTTSVRSGTVTFRVVLTTNGSGQYAMYTVWPTSTSVAGAASPVATQLVVVTQPGGAQPNTAFTQQPVIEIRDATGSLVSSDNTTQVTASITSGTGDPLASLAGTVTVTAVNGVVSFTNLSINLPAPGYRLDFNDGGALTDASSALFNVGSYQGGDDGGDDKGGCSTGGSSGWFVLLTLAALLGVAVRTHRA